MGRSLSGAAQSGRVINTSNGFGRRKIITTAGAFSFILPSEVTECDIAIFGGGGGGALLLHQNNSNVFIPGGAGGGGFARRKFRNISGGTISGAIGARGLGGTVNNSSTVPASAAGSNGGTTTLTFGGVTMTATGGAAGIIETTRTNTRAAGGTGSGGDINADGGKGGLGAGWVNSSQLGGYPSNSAPGGGGSSGSHVGTGGDGGDAYMGANGSTVYASSGAGGGWGGKGANSLAISQGSAGLASFGGTSKGSNQNYYGQNYAYLFPGPQDAEMMTTSITSNNTNQTYVPRLPNWWDIEDNGCASAAGFFPGYSEVGRIPGGLGSGGSNQWSVEPAPAGFGGGGSGRNPNQGSGPGIMDWGERGLVGPGGGGGGVVTGWIVDPNTGNTALAGSIKGMAGGPGCVIIWY